MCDLPAISLKEKNQVKPSMAGQNVAAEEQSPPKEERSRIFTLHSAV